MISRTRRLANEQRYFIRIGAYDEDDLSVVRFRSREAVSDLFSVHVEFASRYSDLALGEIVGTPAVLTIGDGVHVRYLHGVLTEIRQLRSSEKHTHYAATIAPSAWTLTLRTNCRIFQAMTTEAIIRDVCEEHGIAGGDIRFDVAAGTALVHEALPMMLVPHPHQGQRATFTDVGQPSDRI